MPRTETVQKLNQCNQVRNPEARASSRQLHDGIGCDNIGPGSWNAYEFSPFIPVVGPLLSPVQAAVGELVFTAKERVEWMGYAENRRSTLRARGI